MAGNSSDSRKSNNIQRWTDTCLYSSSIFTTDASFSWQFLPLLLKYGYRGREKKIIHQKENDCLTSHKWNWTHSHMLFPSCDIGTQAQINWLNEHVMPWPTPKKNLFILMCRIFNTQHIAAKSNLLIRKNLAPTSITFQKKSL